MPRNRKPKPIEYEVDENGCHICTSHPGGDITFNGKREPVSKFIYRKHFGEPDKDKIIHKVCGNNRCINPDHLKAMNRGEYNNRSIEYEVDENDCHICTSHKRISINGKSMTVHHYIYRIKVGEIPEGKIVAHICGNEKCINSSHLTLTSREETAPQMAKEYTAHPIDFDIDPLTGCFNCNSHATDDFGYHLIRINGKTRRIHRVVFEQMFGEIPEGMVIRHKCDNPHCINPEHLELGTIQDNIRDRNERGRTARGSKHRDAKLTEENVREIRRRLAAGERVISLAREYGVSETSVSNIKKGKTWRHVE